RTPEPPGVQTAIEDYLAFLNTERRAGKTLTKYKKVFDRLADLAQRRRALTVGDIDLNLVDAFRSERVQAGIGHKTLYTETVIIRQLVKFCLSRGQIATDPLKGLRLK